MNDNQFYRHNPNNISNQMNPNNFPGKYEVISQYSNPSYGNYNPPNSAYQNDTNTFNFKSQFSTNSHNNISNQLFQIESKLSNYSVYFTMLWTLLIFSIFAIFRSILHLTDNDDFITYNNGKYYKYQYRTTYEVITFFVNLFHIGAYFFSINSFTKQRSNMNEYTEYSMLGLGISNFVYFFFFIFLYPVTFFTWCMDIFYMIINFLLYFQAKEITQLFKEKESCKMMSEMNRI